MNFKDASAIKRESEDSVNSKEKSEENPKNQAYQLPEKFLIIDCSGFVYIDMMGVTCLKEVYMDLQKKSIRVLFAAAKAPLRELFDVSGFYDTVSKANFYPTIHDAMFFARYKRLLICQYVYVCYH
ncbi:STAS domain protein [Cooperia oncophora]